MAKDKLSKEDKKTLAYDLFINTDKTQTEICAIIDIAPRTFTRWKQDGLWEELKAATSITANAIITGIYKKMYDMTNGDTELNADAMAKLAKVIEVISTSKYTLSQIYNVFKEFTNWLYPKNIDAAKQLNNYMREWVDELISNKK